MDQKNKTRPLANAGTTPTLYRIGGISALLQLLTVLAMAVSMGILGGKPASAEAYFTAYQASPLQAFLRGDFLVMILIALYLGTVPALYLSLRDQKPVWIGYAALFSIITALGAMFSESSFSLLYLGERILAAASEAQRTALVAAWEALTAGDLWNSTTAYLSGIFLQGSGIVFSLVMLRSRDFSKVTAISGLIGNALDLVQHILHPFAPAISTPIQMSMGIFYFVWFPMLARDFLILAKKEPR